jgi:CheY-like chemotaxis protein
MPSPVCVAEREIESDRHSRAQAPPVLTAPACRVLLADPCRDTVGSLAWLLRLWGFDVLAAATGPAALDAARTGRPDVVLMELALPMIDGLQVARRLRLSNGESTPLLVAVTGYGSECDRARTREAGFDCHLVKPVCPEVVRAWLAANCGHEGGRAMNSREVGWLAVPRVRDMVDVTSEDSFPASDAPSWTPVMGPGPPSRVGRRPRGVGPTARVEVPARGAQPSTRATAPTAGDVRSELPAV